MTQAKAAETANRKRARRRILYLTHVDWRWIKQRPQFLAEGLAAEHEVQVLHTRVLRRWNIPAGGREHVHRSALLPIPWRWRFLPGARTLHRLRIAKVARRFRPDVVWVTHPSLMEYMPGELMGLPFIYDCMDDALAMASSEKERAELTQLEQLLVSRSIRVICSSTSLGEVLANRYPSEMRGRLSVIHNAVSDRFLASSLERRNGVKPIAGRFCKIVYIGTVAEWLDFDTLLNCLAARPNIEFHLVGPIIRVTPPRHERLYYHRAVSHDSLLNYVGQFDAFMLPFKVIPLILAVDPVKLYEYLAWGKEIVSVQYPEVDRFGDFVHFYRTTTELIQLVDDLAAGHLPVKNRPEATHAFLERNTWQVRVNQICELLESLN